MVIAMMFQSISDDCDNSNIKDFETATVVNMLLGIFRRVNLSRLVQNFYICLWTNGLKQFLQKIL